MCVSCVTQIEVLAANSALVVGGVSAGVRRLRARRDPVAAAARASVREAQDIAFFASLGLDEEGRPPTDAPS